MSECPHCESSNYRVQEPGAIHNSYYCMNCNRSFDKLSPGAKLGFGGVFAVVSAVATGILHGLFSDSDNSNSS